MAENAVGKGEIAVTSNFSFSRSVFKRLVLKTSKNPGLFEKWLTNHISETSGFFFIDLIVKQLFDCLNHLVKPNRKCAISKSI